MGTSLTGRSWGSSRSAAANPAVPRTMLIRNIGRQVRPAMSALMIKPGDDRAEHGRGAHDRAERGEGAAQLLAGERGDQDADALRDQQGPEPALHQPPGDQHDRTDGQAAPQGGER